MSGLFGSITIPGNRLTEFASTGAQIGVPIPFGFGMFPCEGNPIFAPMPPKEHVKKKKQGKGGVNTTEYSYTLSYAIAFCEGPIYGYLTITRNGKVVYTTDPNATVADKAYAAKWAQKATLYFGTEAQLPDSTIESYKGSGQVSAFRGIAYIVVEDDDVTDSAGAVPTYEAVVIASAPEIYLTSAPYHYEFSDALGLGTTSIGGNAMTQPQDIMTLGLIPLNGELRQIAVTMHGPTEPLALTLSLLTSEHRVVVLTYHVPVEPLNLSLSLLTSEHRVVLVPYSNWPVEPLALTLTPLGGTLS